MLSSKVILRLSGAVRAARGRLRVSVRYQSTASVAKFTLPDDVYKLHRLEEAPSREVEVTREDFQHYLREMMVIREMESEARGLYGNKLIRGFCHVYSGEEASAVGIEAAIDREDPVITAYRCHGWSYTRGIPVKNILAELTGRSTGCQKGKGGSMHMYAPNYYGGNGIVGAQVPVGTGIAFAEKYKETGRLCVTLYGDGAANQGQVFEAFNMAALWKLPCLFVCENNRYGMGTSDNRAAACPEFYTRGHYIPGIRVNGQDILAVREATKYCVDYIQAGKGPLVLEVFTYRYYGHSMSDPGKSYRLPEEVKQARKERDPIKIAEHYGLEGNLMIQEEMKDMLKEVKQEIKEAVAFALESPELPLSELYNDIFSNEPQGYVRGCDPFTSNQAVAAT